MNLTSDYNGSDGLPQPVILVAFFVDDLNLVSVPIAAVICVLRSLDNSMKVKYPLYIIFDLFRCDASGGRYSMSKS